MVIVLMGVSGSGKTTVGKLLAEDLGWSFYDGDAFHPQANIDKMRRGVPLVDEDRWDWLQTIRAHIATLVEKNEDAVIACSALKDTYRTYLRGGREAVHFVYLKGTFDLIRSRMAARLGHFFKPELLKSQFDALEEPVDLPAVDIIHTPRTLVEQIKQQLGL